MEKIFTVSKYQIVIEAGSQGLLLPPYKGSTLRGGFGSAFKRIACSQRGLDCPACLLRTSCPYAYIFETAPPPGSEALRNYENIPRPFILEPPLEDRTEYGPGEKICFNLILIGRAINFLPYFIVAFRELGEMGIGRMRKKYRLAEIRSVDLKNNETSVIYSHEDHLVRNTGTSLHVNIINDFKALNNGSSAGGATLEFQTMTRIKYEEGYTKRLEFHMIVRSLLRRLSSLAYFHHGWELDLDFTGLIRQAAQVSIIEDNTRWVDWERYSSRQDNKMNLAGLVGRVTYGGPVSVFAPLLRLGELTHVGKGAVFGMGKYKIIETS